MSSNNQTLEEFLVEALEVRGMLRLDAVNIVHKMRDDSHEVDGMAEVVKDRYARSVLELNTQTLTTVYMNLMRRALAYTQENHPDAWYIGALK